MEPGILESEVLILWVHIWEPWIFPWHKILSSKLPIMVTSTKPSVRQENFRRLTLTSWKWENNFLFSYLCLVCPVIPSGGLKAALNATRHLQMFWLPWLSGAHLPHFRIGLRAELGIFTVFTLELSWSLRKNLLEINTFACGNVCITTITFNKLYDAS